jgi:hypothetical protein
MSCEFSSVFVNLCNSSSDFITCLFTVSITFPQYLYVIYKYILEFRQPAWWEDIASYRRMQLQRAVTWALPTLDMFEDSPCWQLKEQIPSLSTQRILGSYGDLAHLQEHSTTTEQVVVLLWLWSSARRMYFPSWATPNSSGMTFRCALPHHDYIAGQSRTSNFLYVIAQ